MQIRRLALATLLLGALVPGAAQAEHCDTPIYLFSTTRIETTGPDGNPVGRTVPSAASAGLGCIPWEAVQQDVPDAHDAFDTDVIYPGANRMSVRLLDNGNDPAIVKSATLTFAGDVYVLDLKPTVDVTGAAADFLDSQTFVIDPADTLTGNTAVVKICLDFEIEGEPYCLTRTFRTVA